MGMQIGERGKDRVGAEKRPREKRGEGKTDYAHGSSVYCDKAIDNTQKSTAAHG